MKSSSTILAFAIASSAPLFAGDPHEHEGEHYVRHPLRLDASTGASSFAIGSDAELTVVAYVSEGQDQVFVTQADGRSLEDAGAWSAPQSLSGTGDSRTLQTDGALVVDDTAVVTWSSNESGDTRLYAASYDGSTWSAGAAIAPVGYGLPGADVTSWSVSAREGLSFFGNTYVYVLATVNDGSADHLFLSVSANGGASFGPPQAVSSAGTEPSPAGSISGVGVDVQLGELHVAWADDRDGSMDVWYRRALVDFFGGIAWQEAESKLSTGIGTDAVGSPVVALSSQPTFTGTDQKYVGVAWTQDDGDGTGTLKLRASLDSGATFEGTEGTTIAHTGDASVDVGSFDFEISGVTFVTVWQDNTEDQAGIPTVGAGTQCWRAESTDGGTTFGPAVQVSNQLEKNGDHTGHSPALARSLGVAKAGMIVYVEETKEGPEVVTTFADQVLGGEFHEEYTLVSEAQEKGGGGGALLVDGPKVAQNLLYNNFAVAWRQETPGGQMALFVGGYRPQQVVAEGWGKGEDHLIFEIEHLPFEDHFAFVLIGLNTTINPLGDLPLGNDPRSTGVVYDPTLTTFGLSNFSFFIAPNISAEEGAVTPELPVSGIPTGFPLSYVAISWGPFGELDLITEAFRDCYGIGECP